ncbi:hypothetical protein, partial [Bacillus aerolatus]|uniref:hypothetical protein n=1 Tax=Bacillus aerolatus TaxID=2653354 RepID=UPI001CDC6AD3
KSRGDCLDTTSKCSDAEKALSLVSGRLFDLECLGAGAGQNRKAEAPNRVKAINNGMVLPVTYTTYYPVLKEQLFQFYTVWWR